MHKYLMINEQDYRPTPDNHQVLLVTDGYAFGKFTVVTEDMIPATEEEIALVPKKQIPNISLRQCRELLIVTNRFNQVLLALDAIEDPMEKIILTNYWEHSTEFERNHKSLGLITSALGMSEDEVDEFFLQASKL